MSHRITSQPGGPSGPPAGPVSDGDLRELPIGELLKRLADDTKTLVQQEMQLARVELADKGKRAGVGAGIIGGGAIVGLMAAGAFTAFAILVLDEAMPSWVAALIVAVVFGAIAAGLALTGKNKVQEAVPPTPEQTVETIKEDVEWVKTQTPSGSR